MRDRSADTAGQGSVPVALPLSATYFRLDNGKAQT
jgi:hypothetical protein